MFEHILHNITEQRNTAMESLLECFICLELFTDPRTLPCLHTLCLKCVDGVITSSNQADRGEFLCPVCCHKIAIPANHGQGFPKDFFLNLCVSDHTGPRANAIAPEEEKGNGSEQLKCSCRDDDEDDEDHGDPIKFCTDCAEFYCLRCSKSHARQRSTRSHQQMAREDVTEEIVNAALMELEYSTCSRHKGEKVKVYCDTCKVIVCVICCHTTHQGHHFREVGDVDVECISELKSAEKTILDIISSLKGREGQLKSMPDSIAKCAEEAKLMMSSAIDRLCHLLQVKEKKVNEEITKWFEEKNCKRDAYSNQINFNLEVLERLLSFVTNLEKSGEVVKRIGSLAQLTTHVQKVSRSTERVKAQSQEMLQVPTAAHLVSNYLHEIEMSEHIFFDQATCPNGPMLDVTVKSSFERGAATCGEVNFHIPNVSVSSSVEKPRVTGVELAAGSKFTGCTPKPMVRVSVPTSVVLPPKWPYGQGFGLEVQSNMTHSPQRAVGPQQFGGRSPFRPGFSPTSLPMPGPGFFTDRFSNPTFNLPAVTAAISLSTRFSMSMPQQTNIVSSAVPEVAIASSPYVFCSTSQPQSIMTVVGTGASNAKSPQKTPQKVETSDTEADDSYKEPEFEPIVQLPEKVDLITGIWGLLKACQLFHVLN